MSAPIGAVPGSSTGIVAGLLSIPVFIAANALFVAAEFALVAVRRTRVQELVRQEIRGARRVQAAVADLDRYIAATQLGITLASIGLGWLGQPALAAVFEPLFAGWGAPGSAAAAHSLALVVAFLGVSFLHVVMGELAPKGIALQLPDRTALWVAGPLLVFERVFRPFIWILNTAGNRIIRALGIRAPSGAAGGVHSVTELSLLLEASEEAGVLERQEREMMHGVLAFGDMTVRQIMTPRADMQAVNLADPPRQLLRTALESGYSRLPVIGPGGPDDVVGVLHAKDLLHLFEEDQRDLTVLPDLLRQPFFIKGSARVLDLLKDFQRGEHHLALVLDDFGELIGLATLEDLLEEIVGDIRDEHDTRERLVRLDRDGTFLAAGEAPARDCLSVLGVVPPLSAAGSIGEFVRGLAAGPTPAGLTVHHEDLTFTVLETDAAGMPRRVRIASGRRPGGQ